MDEAVVTTQVRIPERVWMLLRRFAERAAIEQGGRPSVSRAVTVLVEAEAARRSMSVEGDRA